MRHEELLKELLTILNPAEIATAYKTKIKKELVKQRKMKPRKIEKEATKRTIEFLQELEKYGVKKEEIEYVITLYSKDL